MNNDPPGAGPAGDARRECLWAPWRMDYIKQPKTVSSARKLVYLAGADPQCFLCHAVADDRDRGNHVVYRGRHTLTMLNRFPYNNGHLLVSPRVHKASLEDLSAEEHLESMQVLAMMVATFKRLFNAEGFNIGLNLGSAAGAGVPGHLHWHLVPRWSGDINFMPMVANTNVLPQSLETLWEMITPEMPAGGPSGGGTGKP